MSEKRLTDIFDCRAYACYLKDDNQLMKSTSGGVFYGLARRIIDNGGVVFGAAFINSYEVEHICVSKMRDLEKLRKSKYVQSRIGNTYQETKKYLEKGRSVLYSGTPCQIAGLRSFLGKDYANLLTVDLICHGVSTSEILKKHIEDLGQEYGKIEHIDFRSKEKGWNHIHTSYTTNEKRRCVDGYKDAFFWGYEQYYILRPSCYECKFRNMNSGADITIGDYWRIEKEHPDFYNEKGVSAVIVKTGQGMKFFQECMDAFVVRESTVSKIANYNIFLIRPYGKTKMQKLFFDTYEQEKNLEKTYIKMQEKIVPKRIGIIGSYSSRKMIHSLRNYDRGVEIKWQITGSALCSMLDDGHAVDLSALSRENAYRYKALETDLTKTARKILLDEDKCDYIILDLLEERYKQVQTTSGRYITFSEMLEEEWNNISVPVNEFVEMYDMPTDLWKRKCLELVDCLKQNYRPEQIILNCLYLTENRGEIRPKHKFDSLDVIRKVNARLSIYYQFIMDHFPEIRVINIENEATDFCEEKFEHGCSPEYYCALRYLEMRNQLIDFMEE